MCDACPVTHHVPVYTISVMTGERLCLCLDCADHNVEPLRCIIRGVNAGALSHLTPDMKAALRFPLHGKYYPIRALAKINPGKLLPPPPEPDREEERLVAKMKAMNGEWFEATGGVRKPASPSPLQKLLGWVRLSLFGDRTTPALG